MGAIRNLGLAFVTVLLFFAILGAGITASIALSLNYDNVQPKVHAIATEIIDLMELRSDLFHESSV